MNWMLQPNMWSDWWDGSNPPITWNPSTQRYEFMVNPPDHRSVQIGLRTKNPLVEEGVIDFEYEISFIREYPPTYINIIENNDTLISSTEISSGVSGRITVPVRAGYNYDIVLSGGSSVYYHADYFYNFEGIFTPYQEPVVTGRLPWWLCVPKVTPAPCPDRSSDFVSFRDYDTEFKFPMASSRVPLKTTRLPDCIACRPNLIDADHPEPEPPTPTNPPNIYIHFGESPMTFEAGWDTGFSRNSSIDVYKDKQLVGTCYYQPGWFSGDIAPKWDCRLEGYDYDYDGKLITLRQGQWEIERTVVTEFVAFVAYVPQVFPVESYVSSRLDRYGVSSIYYDSPIIFEINGENHWIKDELLNGSFGWTYSENFPVGLEGVPVKASNAGGYIPANAILYSDYFYPEIYHDYRGIINSPSVHEGFNGFRPSEQPVFTLTNGFETYTCTRQETTPWTYLISPIPENHTTGNRWEMRWNGGSCFVVW